MHPMIVAGNGKHINSGKIDYINVTLAHIQMFEASDNSVSVLVGRMFQTAGRRSMTESTTSESSSNTMNVKLMILQVALMQYGSLVSTLYNTMALRECIPCTETKRSPHIGIEHIIIYVIFSLNQLLFSF